MSRNVTTHSNYKDSEVVSVVRAIQDPDTQQTMGVVLIDLKLRVIAETVRDVRLGKSGYLTVIDDKGESIYAPRNSKLESLNVVALPRQQWSGMFAQTVGGRKLQFIYQKSSFTDWTTVGFLPFRTACRRLRTLTSIS